jgi:hypothetical protein
MSRDLSWIDRLRIERVVWLLDQRLYDLPRRARIATRREVRSNLLLAARDVGTSAALKNIGSSAQLASEYRTAAFGDGPRHSWVAAAVFLGTATLLLTSLLNEAALAYRDGVTAADPHYSGTPAWHGLAYLQSTVNYRFDNGHADFTGGAFTPVTWLILLLGTVLFGRLWRAIPRISRRHAATG